MPCANLGFVSLTGHCSIANGQCINSPICPNYINESTSVTGFVDKAFECLTNGVYLQEEVITKEPKQYCKYCFNARIYEPTDEEVMSPHTIHLTDDNDSSSHSIGVYEKEKRFMISAGNGEPVRIEFEYWEPQWRQWLPIGKYYPKYCPECGRKLDEYDKVQEI